MIELRPLAELDADSVEANATEIRQRLAEDNSRMSLLIGPFADYLVHYGSVINTQQQQNVLDYWNARSLKQLNDDPAGADPGLVDDVLSNYRVVRKDGGLATGEVTVIVSDDVTVTIAQGSEWQANGKVYVTSTVFTAKIESSQINSDTDRLLIPLGVANQWAFTITVVAAETGADYAVRKDSLVLPVVPPPNYVTSYATSDFTGGSDTETNDEMLTRLQQGIAAKVLCGRTNMQASLRDIDEFSRVLTSSIIGLGDAEMLRDKHWIWPGAAGGRCDWYVRSQASLYRVALSKTATLVEKNVDHSGVWQISIRRDDAPGFYEIANIRLADDANAAGGYNIVSDDRAVDLTGDGFKPDVLPASAEWIYSRYQTAVVRFTDTDTDTTDLVVGDTADYTLEATCVPLIGDIQDVVAGRGMRHFGADCLVKAPVPCFVQLSLTIYKRTGQDDPDLSAMKSALADAVNYTGFVGALYASQLYSAVRGHLLEGQTVSAIDMLGRIRYPNAEIVYVRSSEKLTIPSDTAYMVSSKTTQFFVETDEISITVLTTIPTDS